MIGASTRVWLMLALLMLGDIAWCRELGISVEHWGSLFALNTALLGLVVLSRRQGYAPRLTAAVEWSVLWIVFTVAGALLTYAAAAQGGTLYDARLATLDVALGFDRGVWEAFLANHPLLHLPLTLAYQSLFPQAVLTVLWFCCRGGEGRNAELLTNATVALLLTTMVFSRFPSFGPCALTPGCHDAYLDDLVGLRGGKLPSLDIMVLKGVVAFPSFHAVLAILFAYAHRGSPTFLPAVVLNLAMLVSIPSEGGHYFVDLFGGVAVGFVSLLLMRLLPARIAMFAPADTG